jgi:uncharacterized protein YbaR (Trm112 family)
MISSCRIHCIGTPAKSWRPGIDARLPKRSIMRSRAWTPSPPEGGGDRVLHLCARRLNLDQYAMRRIGLKKIAVGALIATVAIAAALPIVRPRCIELRGAQMLTVSMARLESGEARLFCYRDRAGERLRFLLARGDDGRVRAVFDACRQCYKFHQGYDVVHGALICRLCGNRYPIDHMMKGEASCVPVSLPHHEDASRVEIKVSDVKSGAALF